MTLKRSQVVALAVLAALIMAAVLGASLSFDGLATPVVAGAVIYIIPSLIAVRRSHHQLPAIVAVNLLVGWTFVGWVVALVWALKAEAHQSWSGQGRTSAIGDLERLTRLRDSGALTEDEFAREKAKILG